MTAQVSRAAADHGLLPQMFARTRAGDTPVAGLVVAGLLGTVAIVLTIAPTLGKQFGCWPRRRRCSRCSPTWAPARRRCVTACAAN